MMSGSDTDEEKFESMREARGPIEEVVHGEKKGKIKQQRKIRKEEKENGSWCNTVACICLLFVLLANTLHLYIDREALRRNLHQCQQQKTQASDCTDIRTQFNTLNTDYKVEKVKWEQTQENYDHLTKEHDSIKTELRTLKEKCVRNESRLKECQMKLTNCETKTEDCNNMKTELQTLKKTYTREKVEWYQCTVKVNHYKDELNDHKEAKRKFHHLEKEHEVTKFDLHLCKTRVRSLTSRHVDHKAEENQCQEMKNKHEVKVAILEELKQQQNKTIDQQMTAYSLLNKKYEDLHDKYVNLTIKYERNEVVMKYELQEKMNDKEYITEVTSKLEKKVEGLKTNNERLEKKIDGLLSNIETELEKEN